MPNVCVRKILVVLSVFFSFPLFYILLSLHALLRPWVCTTYMLYIHIYKFLRESCRNPPEIHIKLQVLEIFLSFCFYEKVYYFIVREEQKIKVRWWDRKKNRKRKLEGFECFPKFWGASNWILDKHPLHEKFFPLVKIDRRRKRRNET